MKGKNLILKFKKINSAQILIAVMTNSLILISPKPRNNRESNNR